MADIVLVKIKDPVLLKSYGPYRHYNINIAIRGQAEGKWEIVKENKRPVMSNSQDQILNTRDDIHLKRKGFKSNALRKSDLFGEL